MDDGVGGAPPPRTPPPCLGLRPRRAPLERFALSVVIMDDGVGVAPAPPNPPLLAGLRPAGNLERFAFRALSESSLGTPTRLKDETERIRGPGSNPEFKPLSRESAKLAAYLRDAGSR